MKVVIVEDEKLSAEHLALLLQRIDNSIKVVRYLEL
jgi:DNA-binding LytR/AlgR family response regulator